MCLSVSLIHVHMASVERNMRVELYVYVMRDILVMTAVLICMIVCSYHVITEAHVRSLRADFPVFAPQHSQATTVPMVRVYSMAHMGRKVL